MATSTQENKELVHLPHVEDGKLAEFWAVEDMLGAMQQLGVVEPPGR